MSLSGVISFRKLSHELVVQQAETILEIKEAGYISLVQLVTVFQCDYLVNFFSEIFHVRT